MLDTNDEFIAYGGQHNYAVFTFLKSFKSYKNDLKGVINLIRTCFHTNDSFIGVSSCPVVIGQFPLLILRFNNKTYADALHNTFNDALKVMFFKFDKETVNQQIANYLEKIDKRTIKLVDIEANFPTETIINVFRNAYGPIEKVQEIFKRSFMKRQTTSTLDNNLNDPHITKKFKHLLTGNFTTYNNERPPKQTSQPIFTPQKQSFRLGPIQQPTDTGNWDTPIMELQSKINILKTSLKDIHAKITTLAQENKELKNQITKLQMDLLNNHKVTISIKEQNSRVKIKQNHILEQFNNLFVQLGATEEDNQSNIDNMSDNASQSNYEYSDDTHITRIVYNNGEIIFNEESLDLPPITSSPLNTQISLTNISLLQCT
ncbi:hypothetical protein RclHR1_09850001 [Rhizophagus clarus]|uniref:Uncharacterized protein n=1 Tax=Rhizophagus clarus TaxID=94130 RepID=A0A2Z6SJB5_9GLOM|nr:hypothetical protein RclHR1_09850001 [Rhizophagus clarus]